MLLQKRCQEKGEFEVSLADLNYQDDLKRIPLPLSPTTIVQPAPWYEEENGKSSGKSVVLIVESHNDGAATHRTLVSMKKLKKNILTKLPISKWSEKNSNTRVIQIKMCYITRENRR